MKLKKINKILKDPTTSKRLKKEINYLFERLEIVSLHRDILQNNKPIESTQELFGISNLLEHFEVPTPTAGKIKQVTLKAIRRIPGIITEGNLYPATLDEKYYTFNCDNGLQTQALIKGEMQYFEVLNYLVNPETNQPKTGEITVLKATKTIPSIITKGDLYYATSNGIYYSFTDDKGSKAEVIKVSDMFEVVEDPKCNPEEHKKKNQ